MFGHITPQWLCDENKKMECGSLNAIQKTQAVELQSLLFAWIQRAEILRSHWLGQPAARGPIPSLRSVFCFLIGYLAKPRTDSTVMLFTCNLLAMYCIFYNAKPQCAMPYPGKVCLKFSLLSVLDC